MFEIILHEPEIPPNTGNVIRLCANSGCRLHLIEPLGFTLDNARLRRAGLDYHEYAGVFVHPNLTACLSALDSHASPRPADDTLDDTLDTQRPAPVIDAGGRASRIVGLGVQGSQDMPESPGHDMAVQSSRRVFAFSTRGSRRHDQIAWQAGDAMLFGAETRGLPADILAGLPESQRVRLPMRPHNRSLNLSNAVAIAIFEAWRQLDFHGGC